MHSEQTVSTRITKNHAPKVQRAPFAGISKPRPEPRSVHPASRSTESRLLLFIMHPARLVLRTACIASPCMSGREADESHPWPANQAERGTRALSRLPIQHQHVDPTGDDSWRRRAWGPVPLHGPKTTYAVSDDARVKLASPRIESDVLAQSLVENAASGDESTDTTPPARPPLVVPSPTGRPAWQRMGQSFSTR